MPIAIEHISTFSFWFGYNRAFVYYIKPLSMIFILKIEPTSISWSVSVSVLQEKQKKMD